MLCQLNSYTNKTEVQCLATRSSVGEMIVFVIVKSTGYHLMLFITFLFVYISFLFTNKQNYFDMLRKVKKIIISIM